MPGHPFEEQSEAEAVLQVQRSSNTSKGSAFWLSILALVVATFLSALDLTAVGTALPTIAADLHGGDAFSWVGSAYALSSTAILPLSGSLADIWGRKPLMLLAILFFSLGSALAGSAQNMNWLIAARTIQGIGGGAIINLCDIITSDLVPLSERGLFLGIYGLVWSFASGIGPPIGGALVQRASWRWVFYINLPLTGVAFVLVWIFLRVRTPKGSAWEKFIRVDWTGNLIVITGTTLAIVGLTFGGIRYPWASAQVLAPLLVGLALIGGFLIYEGKVPVEPSVPWEILSNRTTVGGYLAVFIHGITSIAIIYYLPVYYQAALGKPPVISAVAMLGTALVIAPFALIAAITVQLTNKYRPINALGWVITIVGFGILSMLRVHSTTAQWVGYQILAAVGTGIIYSSADFPVLAPLPVERNAVALAFFAFVRSFAQTWGITITATILQNELKRKLPVAFTSKFHKGQEIAYAAIPELENLHEPLREEVRVAFAESLSIVWKTMMGIAFAGLLSVLLLKEIPLNTTLNDQYGLEQETLTSNMDVESASRDGEMIPRNNQATTAVTIEMKT